MSPSGNKIGEQKLTAVQTMKLRRVLKIAAVVLVVLVIALAAAGVYFVRRPWPQVDGTLAVAGLEAPVEVIRDRWGVPHLFGVWPRCSPSASTRPSTRPPKVAS